VTTEKKTIECRGHNFPPFLYRKLLNSKLIFPSHEKFTETASWLLKLRSKKSNHQESKRTRRSNFQMVYYATLRDLSKHRHHHLDKLYNRAGRCMGSFPVKPEQMKGKNFDFTLQELNTQSMTRFSLHQIVNLSETKDLCPS
jgi:hypothetical protein